MEHAERNAIYNANRTGVPLLGSRLYVNWVPCTDCARAIIQSGIREVIIHKQGQMAFEHSRMPDDTVWSIESDKWDSSHQKSWGMMEETGITVNWFDGILDCDVRGFFTGKEYRFIERAPSGLGLSSERFPTFEKV
jgi:dCMP deaminase